MASFKKLSKFSKSSDDINKKIQSLNEEMLKTGAIEKDDSNEKVIIEKINKRLENIPEEQKTDFIQYVVNTTNNLNEVKGKLLKGLNAVELESFNNKKTFGSVDTKLLNICEDIDKTIQKLQEEAIDTFKYKTNNKKHLNEGLLNEPANVKNSDPLTPLDQNFVTVDQLNDHYRLFINRIQEQIATIGGGGETKLQYLDDIVGIATNSSGYDGKYLKWNSVTNTAEFTTISSRVEDLDATLIAGNISSLGMSVGVITATSFYGDGSTLSGIVTSLEAGTAISLSAINGKVTINSTVTQGTQGVQGLSNQGVQGLQGLQGDQGTQGVQGLQGDQGVQGLQGDQGTQGVQGLQGTQGVQGLQGDQGTQGLQGLQGDQGTQGLQGDQGTQGIQGTQGVQGVQGLQGDQGTQGLQGLYGDQGVQGLQGEAIQGTAGKSVTIVGSLSLTPGNEQNELNDSGNSWYPAQSGNGVIDNNSGDLWVYDGVLWNNVGQIVGPQGTQGVQGLSNQGVQGLQGEQGVQGLQGLQGEQGVQGLQGEQGVQGLQGDQGTQGLQGLQGAQGTQGLQGDQGTQGLWGDQGVQGTQGIQGEQGVQGLQGLSNQGVQGSIGIQGPEGTGGATVTISDIAPSFPSEGNLWYASLIGRGFIYYNDGDSSQWVDFSPSIEGLQGTQGIQGLSNQGTQGLQGTQGDQGTQGLQGDQGTQGLQGLYGDQGVQGLQGDQGTQGLLGDQGAQGTQGLLGDQGTQGLLGDQGTQGLLGDQGTQGLQGLQGLSNQGVQGLQGASGVGGGESYWISNAVGIHTFSNVGIATTSPQTPLQVEIYGVKTGLGTFVASVGVSTYIDTFVISSTNFVTVEYTLYFENDANIQAQKVLVMQNGTTAYSQEYAIMYEPNPIVSIGATVSSGICKLHVTPETGISGIVTYKIIRQSLL